MIPLTPDMRLELPMDLPSIRAVNEAAFERAGEADLVDALRASGKLLVSAVAVMEGRIVAHVAFSAIEVDDHGKGAPAVALAPVAVVPELQGRGLGSAVIRWGIEQCRLLGHEVVIVLGDADYYPRFGFLPSAGFEIQCPFEVPPEVFMVLELRPGAAAGCRGVVRYGAEFDLV